MTKTEIQKLPIRVIVVKDYRNIPHIETMIDMSYFFEPVTDPHQEIAKFKKAYLELIEKSRTRKKSIQTTRMGKAKIYWKLGKLLLDFIRDKERDFRFTNYRISFQRDIGLTDSYVGVLLDFATFFNEDEIEPTIPMSYYFELVLKARQLQQHKCFHEAKSQLIKLAKNKQLPEHKAYRKILAETIASKRSKAA